VFAGSSLQKEYRSKFNWRQLAGLLRRAAEGQQDVAWYLMRCGSCCS
jgi:hypothetical protein